MITDKAHLENYYSDFLKLEKKLFGVDFDYAIENIIEWFKSPYSLIFIKAGPSREDSISAYGSVIIISHNSYQRLMAGQITEEDLVPIERPSESDVAYFASIYSCIPYGADQVIRTAKQQLSTLIKEKGLNIETIFSIASTSRGLKLIKKQGWQQTHLYLDKYPVLSCPVSDWLSK
ncbi:hypothetical protein [Vibrio paucivorans]